MIVNKLLARRWLEWRELCEDTYDGGDIECGLEDMNEVLIPAVRYVLLPWWKRMVR